ncbi:CAP domain-containing protein [Demequina muriae]|uniref:CAP domain-containing protein n=1 Tax=Demequina muriae TaxID=3051664 RepID=A0ABT8GFA2_9MICO|nr:CAP domain-containing protein [Demequina sp. EGI L300058]MDN4480112.1 CAP domain-containing protein [Demequina sp. EGI L300058]
MSAPQEVPGTGRPRLRPLSTFLLAAVPLVIAGVGGTLAANFAPDTVTTPATAPADQTAQEVAVFEDTSDVLPAVVAPQVESSAADAVPQISVSFAPEPEPAPVAQAAATRSGGGSASASSGSTSASSGSGSASKPAPRQSSDAYCASPSSPYSAGGSVKGLLTAANKERARIGVSAMSWSGSLASAATSWSQSMAGRDDSGTGGALAHNPNRPGAENVAVSGSSGGISVGTAVNKAHAGWMYSGGHCRNIMNPSYSTMGAGTATTANGNAVYTTANFR